MIPEYLKDKRGNNKLFFVSVATIGGLVLGLSLSQMRREKPFLTLFNQGQGSGTGVLTQGTGLEDSLKSLMDLEMQTTPATASYGSMDFTIENTLPPSRLAQTEKGLADLRGYIKGIEEQNQSLKDKMNVLTNTIVSREKELMKISADLGDLTSQLKARQEEISALGSAKNSLETKVKELDSKFELLSSAHSDLALKLSRTQQEKEALQKELETLKGDLSKETNLNSVLNKNVADLNQVLGEKESQLARLGEDLAQQASMNTSLNKTVADLKQSLADKDAQLVKTNEDLVRQNETNTSLSEQVLRLDEAVRRKEADLSALQQEIEGLRVKLEEQTEAARKGRTERKALLLALRQKEKRLKELSIELELMIAQQKFER